MRVKKNGSSDALRQQQLLTQLIQQGRKDEAWRKIRTRLLFAPNDVWFIHEAARLARRSGQFEEAVRYYQRGLRLMPQDAGMLNGLGLTHYDANRFDDAEQYYLAALKAHPGYAACHNNYAILLDKTLRYEESVAQYQYALQANPDYAEARYAMSAVLASLGRLDEAEREMRQVLKINPDDQRCNTSLGMVLLQKGQYEEGWKRYQSRYAANNTKRFFALPELKQPYWRGESLAGKTILVKTEQGMGDEIQFCRYLMRLKAEKQAARIIMIGRKALSPLISSLPGLDEYVVVVDEQALPVFDCWSMLLDLPQYFLTSSQPFAPEGRYLYCNTTHDGRWTLSGNKLKVGLVWKGAVGHANDHHRSLPHLSALATLLALPDIEWVSLQKGAGEDEVAEWPQLRPFGAMFNDYLDTASVIEQLDLVIGVDTSVVHLAGAMGKPCWVMLAAVARDWRWQAQREDSSWYSNTRLFSQEYGEKDWSAVIVRLQHALLELIDG
ncbi:glycosyltransferase [Serratia sp. S1B]|nr:glycosyltransferase [Serratia sp. S1B]